MMLLLARLIAAFSSYGKPSQIAAAMALGVSLAVIPGGTILWGILFIPVLLLRLNHAALFGTLGLVRLIIPFADPFLENIGFRVLTLPVLYRPMGRLLSVPGLAWLRLDDAFIFGSLTVAIVVFPVAFAAALGLVAVIRKTVAPRISSLFRKIGKSVPWLGKLSRTVSGIRGAAL